MLKINKEKCIGCGMCASLCAEIFELKEDGKSVVKKDVDNETSKDCIRQAIEACPVGAIEETK